MLGTPEPADKAPEITAVEVDIIPAAAVETVARQEKASPAPSELSPPVQTKRQAPNWAPVVSRTEFLPTAIPGETNDVSVANANSADVAVVAQGAAGEQAGRQSGSGAGEADNSAGGAKTPPAYLYGSKPVYPQSARKAGWEGVVVLRAFINTDGTVATATVKESAGYDSLDEGRRTGSKKVALLSGEKRRRACCQSSRC